MTIKEIRQLTGLTQKKFAEKYNIPIKSLKNWEVGTHSMNHRECPIYVRELLERVVKFDCTNEISVQKTSRKSKDKQIQDLKQELECVLDVNRKMKETGEESFFYSAKRMMLEEELDFYKNIAEANALALANAEAGKIRKDEQIRQLYEDNKKILRMYGKEYKIGLDDISREERYHKLQEENNHLKGKLEAKEFNCKVLEEKVEDLIKEIAEYRAELVMKKSK